MVSKLILLAFFATLIVASLQEVAEGEKSSVQQVDLVDADAVVRDERGAWSRRRKSTTTKKPKRRKPTTPKPKVPDSDEESGEESEEKPKPRPRPRPSPPKRKPLLPKSSSRGFSNDEKPCKTNRDCPKGETCEAGEIQEENGTFNKKSQEKFCV